MVALQAEKVEPVLAAEATHGHPSENDWLLGSSGQGKTEGEAWLDSAIPGQLKSLEEDPPLCPIC